MVQAASGAVLSARRCFLFGHPRSESGLTERPSLLSERPTPGKTAAETPTTVRSNPLGP